MGLNQRLRVFDRITGVNEMVSIYLSCGDNAKAVTEAMMRAGLAGGTAKEILERTEKVIFNALADLEKQAYVKCAMDAKEELDKNPEMKPFDVISGMIAGF